MLKPVNAVIFPVRGMKKWDAIVAFLILIVVITSVYSFPGI